MTAYSARLVVRRVSDRSIDTSTTVPAPFEARWIESEGQISRPFPLTPPLSSEDAADLCWYLEKYHEFIGAGTQARAHQIETKLEPWGRALFDALFGTVEGTNVYRNMFDVVKMERPVLLTLGTVESDILVTLGTDARRQGASGLPRCFVPPSA